MFGPTRKMSDVEPLHQSIPTIHPNNIGMRNCTVPGLIHDKDLSIEGTIGLYMVRMIVNGGCYRFWDFGFLLSVIKRIKRKTMPF